MFRPNWPAAVLWDLDGTLIDSEPYWMQSERDFAGKYGSDWTDTDGLKLVGLSLEESSRILKEKTGAEVHSSEVIEHLTNGVVAQLNEKIHWRPGAQQLLRALKRRRIKTALVTMSMRRMALQVVEAIDFKAFDVVVAADDVRHGKPHPEPYLKAAELLGVSPADCIVFEDSISGLLSAEAAGTMAIGVPNLMIIPEHPGRVLVPTLEGLKVKDLMKLFDR